MNNNLEFNNKTISEIKEKTYFFKRSLDVIASFGGIVVLSPIFITISILIKLTSNGPVFFKQTRVGLHGKEFKILKYRTMIVDAEKYGKQITIGNDNRITRLGKILRKYKLDELPQLFNVLVGDMSLVGPRPEVPKYVNMYSNFDKLVLSVKPGITDIASIQYIDENEVLGKIDNPEQYYIDVIMKEKIELNLCYIDNMSFIKDISIIFNTIFKCCLKLRNNDKYQTKGKQNN